MLFRFFFFWCLFFTEQVISQVITVLDETTNEPLEFVSVTSEIPKVISTTDSYGQTDISSFSGSEKITFQHLGYITENFSFKQLDQNHFIIYLQPSNISLDQVVISATKWKQTYNEIPSRIVIISPKDIEFQNPQTAADLLNISGEVYIQKSQQGGGSPMIRGFATNRVLISVDGIRMNNAIFRSGNIQNVISLDPYAIDNTEVLFGPGSIIYGSDAIGGSMNFFTSSPQLSITSSPKINGSANYRYSSANNENTGHFDINFGWKKFALLTSISYNNYDDLLMGSNGPKDYLRYNYVQTSGTTDRVVSNDNSKLQVPTGYSQLNLMQKIRFTPDNNWYMDYGFHYSKTSDFDRYDRLIRTDNEGFPKSAEWYYGPQIWMMNNLNVTYLNSNTLYDDMVIRLAHQLFKESRNDRDFNDTDFHIREEKVNALSLNFDFNKKIDQLSKLTYGTEFVYNKVNSNGENEDILTGERVEAQSRYPESDWTSIAAYFMFQKHLSSTIYMQSGLRYNYFHLSSEFDTTFYPFQFTSAEISNGALTGSLGFVYTPSSSLTIGLNLSTGFRSPNVDDIGKVFDSEPGSVVVPNTDLDVEYAYNAELNGAKLFGDLLKLDFSAYYTFLDNAMVRRDFTFNGLDSIYYNGELSQVQAIQNAANAYIWGIQVGFDLRLSRNLLFSGQVNYQKGEEELDNGDKSALRHAAPLFGNTSITYDHNDLRLDLSLIYNGEISYSELAESERSKDYLYAADSKGNPYSPSWYSLNFKISYKLFQNVILYSGIENITDQRYRQYSSGIAAPGRNFILSTKVSF